LHLEEEPLLGLTGEDRFHPNLRLLTAQVVPVVVLKP
jgi:hypothetical protein